MRTGPVTDVPPLPPDPFTPVDLGFAFVMTEFRGLRKAGAGIAEAAMITAAHCVINSMTLKDRDVPE
jgi:hypothetical protein